MNLKQEILFARLSVHAHVCLVQFRSREEIIKSDHVTERYNSHRDMVCSLSGENKLKNGGWRRGDKQASLVHSQ